MTMEEKIRRLIIIEKQTHSLISDLQVKEDLSDKEFEIKLKEISGNLDCLYSFFQMGVVNSRRAKIFEHHEEIYNRAAGQERGE